MFSEYSFLGRLVRRVFGFDEARNARLVRGEAHPIGRDGGGVWIGFTPGGTPWCYLVTEGPTLQEPVAVVWSKEDLMNLCQNEVGRAGYRTARRIAADFTLAGGADRNCRLDGDGRFPGRDLRGANHDFLLDLLEGLAFFPTGRRGNKRSDCDHCGCLYTPEGIITMLVPHDPWPIYTGREIPMLGEMNIGEGFTPIPPAMKNHLDKIDPLPKKNSGQVATDIVPPGQLDNTEAATMAAA